MKYKKIVIDRPGGPELLKIAEADLANPSENEIRLKILAAGVAYADVLMREGVYPGMPAFPITPGYDVVGTAETAGPSAAGIEKGKRYAALTVHGGYAQYMNLRSEELVPVPESVSSVEAAACVLNYTTAYQMLHHAAVLKKDDAVLVFGAAGGVGTALLQLGKLMGLKLFGTSSPHKKELVESYGAVWADYHADFESEFARMRPEGFAAVFDGTGEWLYPSYRLLKKDGRLIVFGASSMLERGRKSIVRKFFTLLRFRIFFRNFLPRKKRILFYSITSMKKKSPELFRESLKRVFELLEEKKIEPVIAQIRKLEDAALCHSLLNESAVSGKIVILP